MCRLFKALAFERDDALIARHVAALLDRQSEMAFAEQFAG